MGSQQRTCPLNLLPFEVLCKIFDQLDLRSVKSASLTCQRWEQIIFSNHYIKRFTLYVACSGRSISSSTSTTGKHEMKHLARLIKASKRCYPNLTLEFDRRSEFTDHAFHMLFESLSCQKLDHLVVLKLVLKADPDLMVMMVVNAVPEMSRLAALHITLGCGYGVAMSQPEFHLHLKSASLRHLELKAFLPDSMNLPSLKSLEVSLHLKADMIYGHSLRQRDEMPYSLQLERLEELTFSQPPSCVKWHPSAQKTNRPGYKFRFYQQLTGLKKLHLFENKTPENIFLAICDSCTCLTELWIEGLQILDPNAPRHLTKLPFLRRLTVNEFIAPSRISFQSAHLPNLEHLQLGRGTFAYDSFRVLGTVKSLQLQVTVKNIEESMRAIAQHMHNLTVLSLNLDAMPDCDPLVVLQSLHLLTTVRELVLEGGFFHQYTYQPPNAKPMPELQKLRFRDCRMHSRELPWLSRMFPNLTVLDMRQCQFL
ncbi:uncharacterized protein LOC131287347 [Anopheles ziemanni]|uniref:uncharacterized protein LOC131272781 n=1 Tax=Anopheles coustani TaxID=139045 RepID=UPI0026582FF3|nr:uncharacterized protein LOC131272781 [Anopheles coustani]XP_058172372.1 uncharacterized protein LOC131287347 [Anopheles ziemanni]